MIVQVHFNGDFMRKDSMLSLGFLPTTFLLTPTCLGVTFLTVICISLIHRIAPYWLSVLWGPWSSYYIKTQTATTIFPKASTSNRVGIKWLPELP